MMIKYKCRCTKEPVEIAVPDRRPGADLLEWMEMVQHCVGVDHRALNVLCRATTISELYIPHPDGASEVGVPLKRN